MSAGRSSALLILLIFISGCGDSTPDLSQASSTRTSSSTTPTDTTVTPKVNTYDLFHPIQVSVSASTQDACTQLLSARLGAATSCTPTSGDCTVACTQGGSCAGGSSWGFCGFGPVETSRRTDPDKVLADYQLSDANFVKVYPTAKFLRHLYQAAFHRDPDQPGFYYWINAYFDVRTSGNSSQSIKWLSNSMVKSMSDNGHPTDYANAAAAPANFVNMVYFALLNVAPDQAKINELVAQMSNGKTPDQLIDETYNLTGFTTYLNSLGIY